MIRLKLAYTDKHGGSYFKGDRARFNELEEGRLVSIGVAEYDVPHVRKPANARAATAAHKKQMMAAEIKRLGGTAPAASRSVAVFEQALKEAKDGD